MIKIALNNWMAGSGKDACADYLVENHGFKKYALADGIYKIAYEVFDMKQKERPLLWHIGEKLREYDIMVWIEETLRRIKADGHDRVIITDVRKLLEHSYLQESGWENVMIYCDPKVALERLKSRDGEVKEEEVMNNSLENQLRPLKDIMKTIDNSDDFEETKKELDAYVKFLESSLPKVG
ncbi:AAA family ATPase [Priestia aryabhattai]|uniref:dephospho-CoA kinase n=1 Tax=Priestia megaterium TaxID=1404 RepID=UPI003F94B886